MVTKAKALTREEKLEARRQEIGVLAQMEAAHAAEQVASQAEHDAFAARVQVSRDAIDTHIKRSWAQRSDEIMTPRQLAATRAEIEAEAFAQVRVEGGIPTLADIYRQTAQEEQAQREADEAARIASITPRQLWMSTLPYGEKQRITTWESINRMPYPVPGLE